MAGGLCLAAGPQPARSSAPALSVSFHPAVLHPGDVVLVSVSSPGAGVTVSGTAFKKPLVFWPADEPGRWQALVGLGLETRAGGYDVAVRGVWPGGESTTRASRLTVQAKEFETRRLTVEPRFVDPPEAEGARIAREAKVLASLFARSSPRLWRGEFAPPVPGKANSSFGRLTVFNGEPRGRHQGADFAAGTGTPVRAPNVGQVVLAEDLYFSGNTVVLDHGAGLVSLFAHLSRMAVEPGQMVGKGDVLGDVGATGRVTGPHLHWAVRLAEVSVDPLSLIRAAAALAGPANAAAAR